MDLATFSLGPDLDSVVERVQAQTQKLREVGGAGSLDAAMKPNRPALDSAYVIPGTEQGGENEVGHGGYQQAVRVVFSVVIVAQNVGDARGMTATRHLRELRSEVARSLVNWVPAWAEKPIEWFAGSLQDMAPGELWWEDKYRTQLTLEA